MEFKCFSEFLNKIIHENLKYRTNIQILFTFLEVSEYEILIDFSLLIENICKHQSEYSTKYTHKRYINAYKLNHSKQ